VISARTSGSANDPVMPPVSPCASFALAHGSIHVARQGFVEELTKPPFLERAERYLVAAAEQTRRLDQWFKPGDPSFVGVSYSDDTNELVIILEHLRNDGLLTNTLSTQGERLTPKGYIFADQLRTKRAASSQAFVAMWFTDEMEAVYSNGLEPGIRNAGFAPMLIRKKEHVNKIDDEIIAEIRRSAFIVADFTGHRQNVYFETGFGIGLGLQVIWTCWNDHIPELHFDIRQYNCIDWGSEAELAERLRRSHARARPPYYAIARSPPPSREIALAESLATHSAQLRRRSPILRPRTQPRHPKACRGCGRSPLATMRTATPTHGYEPTREAAMIAFAKSWRRE